MGYPLIKNYKIDGFFAETGSVIHSPAPDKIVKVSDNEVYAVYGKYKQTWTAKGSGNTRTDFVEKIEEVGE